MVKPIPKDLWMQLLSRLIFYEMRHDGCPFSVVYHRVLARPDLTPPFDDPEMQATVHTIVEGMNNNAQGLSNIRKRFGGSSSGIPPNSRDATPHGSLRDSNHNRNLNEAPVHSRDPTLRWLREGHFDMDTEQFMKNCCRHKRILFYPSSYDEPFGLFLMNFNIFILSDKAIPTGSLAANFPELTLVRSFPEADVYLFEKKLIFMFYADNNRVFALLQKLNLKLSAFVGICDGCSEGGNYECVNSEPWLSKVFAHFLFPHPKRSCYYITDHMEVEADVQSIANRHNYQIHEHRSFQIPFNHHGSGTIRYHKITVKTSADDPTWITSKSNDLIRDIRRLYSDLASWELINKRFDFVWKSPTGLQVTLECDDMNRHTAELDGEFGSETSKSKRTNIIRIPNWTEVDSGEFARIITEHAMRNQWNVVGIIAFGQGNHANFLAYLKAWEGEYPKKIRVFHLDLNDFADIRPQFDGKTYCGQEFRWQPHLERFMQVYRRS
jgi:hypothetical protein